MVDIHIETGGILIPSYELPEEHQKLYEKYLQNISETEKKLTSDEWYLRYLSFT
ncbi:hypothetical protein LDC_0275 [sediment metagenome]|uniref:Uncharacterized protein n=1 Tax=sediment metagenome TaxID=749907 RepID=D9PFJ3_9ZZZZ